MFILESSACLPSHTVVLGRHMVYKQLDRRAIHEVPKQSDVTSGQRSDRNTCSCGGVHDSAFHLHLFKYSSTGYYLPLLLKVNIKIKRYLHATLHCIKQTSSFAMKINLNKNDQEGRGINMGCWCSMYAWCSTLNQEQHRPDDCSVVCGIPIQARLIEWLLWWPCYIWTLK